MLQPKKLTWRKQRKGRITGDETRGTNLAFGEFGLKAIESERITARQIEAARRAISRQMKRQGKIFIRVFPDIPVTKKPAEVRMGSGKGSVEYYVFKVRPGRILFELKDVQEDVAREALRLAAMKLPIKCKIISNAWDK
jgi:large subunit ribosomal protein L16